MFIIRSDYVQRAFSEVAYEPLLQAGLFILEGVY